MAEMTDEEFVEADNKIRCMLYEMNDRQKDTVLYNVAAQTSAKYTIFTRSDLKRAVENILKREPSDDILDLMENSSIWRDLNKKLSDFGKTQIDGILSGLRRS